MGVGCNSWGWGSTDRGEEAVLVKKGVTVGLNQEKWREKEKKGKKNAKKEKMFFFSVDSKTST